MNSTDTVFQNKQQRKHDDTKIANKFKLSKSQSTDFGDKFFSDFSNHDL
jgi:hypothetical protein